MIKKLEGRHCCICHKPGGDANTEALRALGFTVVREEGLNMYAHAPCIHRLRLAQKKKLNK